MLSFEAVQEINENQYDKFVMSFQVLIDVPRQEKLCTVFHK